MDAPTSASQPKVSPRAIEIAVNAQGRIVWDGAAVPDRAALAARLDAVAAETPQPALHIAPDAQAPYDAVAEVLAEAQEHGIAALGLLNERKP
jgi:biopolymer transport protein ExbD